MSRATVFLRLSAALIIGEMIASPVSATLMNRNTWLPMLIGLGSLILATCMPLIFPETLGRRDTETLEHAAATSQDCSPERPDQHESLRNVKDERMWRRFKSRVLHVRVTSRFMWENTTVLLLLFTFLVTTLGRFVQELLMQYTTKRFHWTWSQVSLTHNIHRLENILMPRHSLIFRLTNR